MQERVIVAKRWNLAATLPLAVLGISLGVWAIRQHGGVGLSLTGWLAIFLGGASLPVLLLQVLRPPRLRLRPDVLIIDGAFNQKVVRWSDIDAFYLGRMSAAKYPALRYKEGRAPVRRGVASAPDQAIAAPWPLKAEAMVDVLNQCRQELVGGA
ncbi:MAG TPA: hypothetical protein VFN88_01445 [Caulobacteraceae bacterium]|nr:hypothetical protein [Caulobacteraceae bacterium]